MKTGEEIIEGREAWRADCDTRSQQGVLFSLPLCSPFRYTQSDAHSPMFAAAFALLL